MSETKTRRVASDPADKPVQNMGFDPLSTWHPCWCRKTTGSRPRLPDKDWSNHIDDIANRVESELDVPLSAKSVRPRASGGGAHRRGDDRDGRPSRRDFHRARARLLTLYVAGGEGNRPAPDRTAPGNGGLGHVAVARRYCLPSLPRLAFRDSAQSPLTLLDREAVTEHYLSLTCQTTLVNGYRSL